MRTKRIIISILLLFASGLTHAQADSTVQSLQELSSKYITTVDNKIEKYNHRLSSKTEKTLAKLSRWENKIQALLQKVNPEAAQRLFGSGQTTFSSLLQKLKEGKSIAEQYKARYDEYRDKLTTNLSYLQQQKDAKGILRKIQGRRARKIEKPEANETETGEATTEQQLERHISVSQLSFHNLLDHFRKLAVTVTQQPLYAPNEAALSAAGLQEKLDSLEILNQAVIDANTKWSNARIKRDKTLSDPVTGVTQLVADVKAYVGAIFGSTSERFKQIKGIKFRR